MARQKPPLYLFLLILCPFALLALLSKWLQGEEYKGEYTPLYGYHYLVAGSADPDYRDGNFVKSAFKGPRGLAATRDGKKLYVADTGNHALRLIDLANHHRVSTFCGNGKWGDADGVGVAARLSAPAKVMLSGDETWLYFIDQSGRCLKRADTKTGEVFTVFKGFPIKGGTDVDEARLTSLAMDHQGRDPVFLDQKGKRIATWESLSSTVRILASAPVLETEGCALAVTSIPGVFVYEPKTGSFYNVKRGGRDILDPALKEVSGTAAEMVEWTAKVPGGQGFVPCQDRDGNVRLCLWLGKPGYFKLIHPGDKAVDDFLLYDGRGEQMSLPSYMPATEDLSLTTTARRLFNWEVDLAFEGRQRLLYVSEKRSNRILALKLVPRTSENHDGLNELDYPVEKPGGVHRILFVGDSLCARDVRGGMLDKLVQYPRQFELWLNTFNALSGTGKRYEVLVFQKFAPAYGGSPLSQLLRMGEIVDKYKIDEILLQMTCYTMVSEGLAFTRARPLSKGDDITGDQEMAWEFLPIKEREKQLGPLAREFLSYLRKERHGEAGRVIGWYGEGDNASPGLVPHNNYSLVPVVPGIRERILKKLDYVLGKDKEFASKHHASLGVVLMPARNFIGMGELDDVLGGQDYADETSPAVMNEPIKRLAAGYGFKFYDMFNTVRILDPPLFPMVAKGDPHYLNYAHTWLGWILAQQYYYGTE